MIWIDHIQQGLVFLSSEKSEKFNTLLTSDNFVVDLNNIKNG